MDDGKLPAAIDEAKGLSLIVEAILYCRRVRELGMPSTCYTKALREPIHFLWERRDGRTKIQAPQFRSEMAQNKTVGTDYDHVIPFACLMQMLLGLEPLVPGSVRETLCAFDIVARITKAEHRIIAGRISHLCPEIVCDPFARYRVAGIKVTKNEAYPGEWTARLRELEVSSRSARAASSV